MNQCLKSDISKDLLFFISEEKLCSSLLYELIKISPGRWFDIEELNRMSVREKCKDKKELVQIIKSIDKFEYNDLTGQIRIKDIKIVEDIVNERTVMFHCLPNGMSEEILSEIIETKKLTKLIARFVKFYQLDRRDFRPLGTILKNKFVIQHDAVIVILKMSSRFETLAIERIIKQLYPDIKSCLAITNYFPDGCLSINQSIENMFQIPSIKDAMNGFSLIICNFIYRINEYAVILDHLIENELKPLIYRNFTEFRKRNFDMKCLQNLEIPECYIGCFSIMTFNTNNDAKKAHRLIEGTFTYLDVKPIEWFKESFQSLHIGHN